MKNIIGKFATITDKDSPYYKHWGYIVSFDGERYHIGGGSISTSFGEITPIFDRDQFRVKRKMGGFSR